MAKQQTYPLSVLIVIVILGLLAGFTGGLFGAVSVTPYGATDTASGRGAVPRAESERVPELAATVAPTLVEIYPARSRGSGLTPLASAFLPAERLGIGFFVTSDGWVATSAEALRQGRSFLLVAADRRAFPTQAIVFDPVTDTAFIRIAADNRPTLPFGASSALRRGEDLYVFGPRGESIVAELAITASPEVQNRDELVRSSERVTAKLFLASSVAARFAGAPVVNRRGEIVGVLTKRGEIVSGATPWSFVQPVLGDVFRGEGANRPRLGVQYADLATLVPAPADLPERGALVVGVLPDSPAAALLRPNDVITRIGVDALDASRGLAEVIADYHPGDKVSITVIRGGETLEIPITFGRISGRRQ
ncbi:MAG: S1C family serine protease [Patescibacteria group bacterium]